MNFQLDSLTTRMKFTAFTPYRNNEQFLRFHAYHTDLESYLLLKDFIKTDIKTN